MSLKAAAESIITSRMRLVGKGTQHRQLVVSLAAAAAAAAEGMQIVYEAT